MIKSGWSIAPKCECDFVWKGCECDFVWKGCIRLPLARVTIITPNCSPCKVPFILHSFVVEAQVVEEVEEELVVVLVVVW